MSGIHTLPNEGLTNEWLTPPGILDALGPFDLDPCAPIDRPWDTARRHYTKDDDGLRQPWSGFVWMNPPYGQQVGRWLAKMVEHGDGIALIAARTETDAFHRFVWGAASALLFLRGRLFFHRPDGTRGHTNAGGPSVLVAYGTVGADRLQRCGIDGALVAGWSTPAWLMRGLRQERRERA